MNVDEIFPKIRPDTIPCGYQIIVQMPLLKRKTKSGIILPDAAHQDREADLTVGKVISIGQWAFRHRVTNEPWPEGRWAEEGCYIRMSKFHGQVWHSPFDPNNEIRLVMMEDKHILGVVPDEETMLALLEIRN